MKYLFTQQDQPIQKVDLEALEKAIKENMKLVFFMTDDDDKLNLKNNFNTTTLTFGSIESFSTSTVLLKL